METLDSRELQEELEGLEEFEASRGEDFPTGSYVMPAGAHLPVGLVVGHAADGWPEVAWPTGTECEAPSDLVLVESPVPE